MTDTLDSIETGVLLDPITLEVVHSALNSLADQMALTVARTAYSGIVRDVLDFSTAFCDPSGTMIAQGMTLVVHLGSFPRAVRTVREKFDGDINEGDIFVMNDPYSSGGIHLPDIFIIKPVFIDGVIEGYSTAVAHHTDVGGSVPGSQSTGSTEIFQEGLMIPMMKLYERGAPVSQVFDFIATNVRVPIKVLGDVRAEIAGVLVGEREFTNLAAKYGIQTIRGCMAELVRQSERLAREDIAAIPDGRYEHTSYIDSDGVLDERVVIHAAVLVSGDTITVDLTGSSSQVPAGINSPIAFTKSAARGAVRMVLGDDIPNAVGYFRAIDVIAPEGSVVNPVLPAACAVRGITGARIMDAVLGALAQALPKKVPADGEGGNASIVIGGTNNRGETYICADAFAGARGGSPGSDAFEGIPHPYANIANTPVELVELDNPVLVEEYSIVPDTAGAGMHRGSFAQSKSYRLLEGTASMEVRSDKRTNLPYPLQGGSTGAPSMNWLRRDGESHLLPTLVSKQKLIAGDVVTHVLAGGAGWGNPMQREPQAVLWDITEGKLSVDRAFEQYGVVLSPDHSVVDAGATASERGSRSGK